MLRLPDCPRSAIRNAVLAALAGAGAPAAHADDPSASPQVVVTATRVAREAFDLPAAIDVVGREQITTAQARVNASEALAAVPGIVVQNRQNYAQDLQISSRGFGARSAFGVRGVRLIADGIPATMPDGQGQAATFNLDMAERIEVLRGPFSAVYGNHAGGVIQLFTREGRGRPSVEASVVGGSDNTWKLDTNAQGEAHGIGYVLDTSRFSTDGFRDHGAATRNQAFAKISLKPDADSRLVLTANGLRQKDTQDPLGLTWVSYQRNPRAAEAVAESFNTRKSIDHLQTGVTYERSFGSNRLGLSAYVGNRNVTQYQAIPPAAQSSPRSSGGVVGFERDFGGASARWTDVRRVGEATFTTTIGVDYDRSRDDRQGHENFVGSTLGIQGRLRRDEKDVVTSLDPYVQTEWQLGQWITTAGLRHSRMRVEVDDHYLINGNDSGSIVYRRTTPVLGILYKLSREVRLYASAARGFEAPTLNELFYTGNGNGFNFMLRPARSTHIEAGAKTIIGGHARLNVALFQVKTADELLVDVSAGGRTSYRNASRTLRQGVEVSLDTSWRHGLSGRLALTGLRAEYDAAVGAIAAGNKLPGVPRHSAFAQLAWKGGGYHAAMEAIANARVHVDDANQQRAAPGYAIANLRAGGEQKFGRWRVEEFVRLNNLFERKYIGSVIVGDGNGRYYEPAPARNWLLGLSAQYSF